MSVINFLEVNGSFRRVHKQGWFRLPRTRSAARSLRFGHHTIVADKTVQILPLGDQRNIKPESQSMPSTPPLWVGWLDMLISSNHFFSFTRQYHDKEQSWGLAARPADAGLRFSTLFTRLFHGRRISLHCRTQNGDHA
ncbi:MAG: hypothetical protein HYV35_09200 [Lentisphaerae bacterium]|nr:hypothetical protein [Lentisphaerota bacterium]